jgi:hypothetical protein
MLKIFIGAAILLVSYGSIAEDRLSADEYPKIEELRWVDNGFLERQRSLVNDITRLEFGSQLRGNKSDIVLLQRVLDKGLIKQAENVKLQALGVALGDTFVKELGLEWRVYRDEDGKSRAVCMPKSKNCLFPITMISKRARLGVIPKVQTLFDKGASYMKPFQPKLPYQYVPEAVKPPPQPKIETMPVHIPTNSP